MNINDNVSVVLTQHGADAYNEYSQTWNYCTPTLKKAGDTLKVQLWHLMQVFGPSMYLGMSEAPFLNCQMEIC